MVEMVVQTVSFDDRFLVSLYSRGNSFINYKFEETGQELLELPSL